MNYDELRAKAEAAKHGYSYRGFGYAEYIAAVNPSVVLGLLDRIAELEKKPRNLSRVGPGFDEWSD